jgi:hypothetical protein
MGLGLVMNTRFQLGKLATLQTMGRSQHALSAHSSRSANSHLHGLAATVRLSRHWRVTAFASHQAIDATLNDNGSSRTLLYSGSTITEPCWATTLRNHPACIWKGVRSVLRKRSPRPLDDQGAFMTT